MHHSVRLSLLFLLTALPGSLFAQERPWEYWGNPEGYLDNQAEVLFGLVDGVLQRNPAAADPSPERQLALASLDALVHDTRNDGSPALHAFLDTRVGRVVGDLSRPSSRKGVEVYKLYNDGFVVRTREAVVGFDLCGTRGKEKYIPDALMRELVSSCDLLLISHRDPDHADRNVVAMASELGIPVYGPEDYDNDRVVKVRTEDFSEIRLEGRGGGSLAAQALPGHQDGLQNNIWVVTFPGGYTVAHCGDQYLREDLAWLKNASEKLVRPLDVLIIDCWAMEMEETVLGFSPRVVITGHENEMGHTIDHREAFWLSQYKVDALALPVPTVILCWGEGYRFKR